MSVAKRPGTPGSKSAGHTRDGSWVSDPGTDQYSRSLRSPALPDSPMIGPGHNAMHSFNSSLSTTSSFESPRPTSVVSGIDIGSPVIAPVDSRRSSKQNRPSSPFTLTPFQPLIFSPVANSSRSSLESVGSSYHSWNGDDKDRSTLFFADPEPQRGAWHDIALPSQLNSDGSNADDGEAEDMVLKYAGLKNIDFVAIQEKLVSAATKPPATAAEVRTPSLRRGRPSTSQSTYSLNGRIASPPQSPTTISPPSDGQMVYAAESEPVQDVSPTTRRHRDLTKALFGDGGEVGDESGVPGLVVSPSATSFLPPSPRDPPSSATWPHPLPRSPSTPRLPQTEEEHEELAREIQRKADAAMIMLHKQPSNSNLAVPPKGSTRKRINPHQISTPQLVSASTSVDTIPLPSPSLSGGQFKIGSRLKRLRGSLRTKTMPTAHDVTPFPPELQSPQAARYDPTKFRAPGPTVMSATEFEGFKVSAPLPPSPPASAGPGLKGFMARFRGRQRASDNPLDSHADLRPMYKSGPSSETLSSGHVPAASPDDGRAAIKQLFDAASNLGLDQTALNDLLVRSGSTSSRASEWSPLSRNASRTTSNEPARSHRTHPSIVAESPEPVVERKAEAERKESNAVVRRTIIFPSESRTSTIDISVLLRKHSSRRRRASSASVSSRSVHDRVPTPPPPKPQRFSNVPAPPLPSADKTASARDTYYDMHGNAADAASSQGGHGQSGPAVEVVELASGETIWKIVNGLRNDDDDLDAFNHRGSFASDYSLRDSGDGVQVFFKEHGRKGSGSSYFGRKKSITAKSGRPETKVFYSSSAQIGRLIENISEGMEAGSFNFLPTTPGPAASAKPAKFVPSTASSLVEPDWTLEETLDHMISSNMRR
ncbi:unnamed protein product [Mycena citricolor]|uniref:Uncharacterized protein n=1 Tax=Mycena citricolor TaxID=2018698 RepID=A0AAD2HN07_9AGAR|nr:unnamed protein product [Mycena citricolor]